MKSMNNLFHRYLTVLAAVMLTAIGASAYDFKVNGIYYNIVSDGVEVTSNPLKYWDDIKIPAKVTHNSVEYDVVGVGNDAFHDCQITSVSLPEGLKRVGTYAFKRTPIQNITFPSTLESIGGGAFWGTAITEVVIPSNVKYLGKRAFTCCRNLTDVVLNCQTAGSNIYNGSCVMFEDCTNLTSMRVAGSIQTLQGCFIIAATKMREIYVGENVKYLTSTTFLATSVQDIYFMNPNPPEYKYSDFNDIILGPEPVPEYTGELFQILNCVNVHIPEGSREAYCNSKLMIHLPENVNIIEDLPSSSIDEMEVGDGTEITVADGRIIAEGIVEVYAADGRLVGRGLANELPTLKPGFYIVRTSAAAKKIMVR